MILPSGLHVGRSNTRQVAERRLGDVQAFLSSLFALADEIAHSDLVYTFFHPLLRDQQDVEPQRMRRREGSAVEGGSGSLKISIQYANGVLAVLILHAQSLALTAQGLPPNPYVKVYLMPDPTKETKRKTRVLKRNSHPSFMEMLEYRLPMDVINGRKLHATVWHYDSLQENTFLGGVIIPLDSLPLREETVSWYTLEYIPRSKIEMSSAVAFESRKSIVLTLKKKQMRAGLVLNREHCVLSKTRHERRPVRVERYRRAAVEQTRDRN
ncbi:Phosphatidylinositol 4-phosphate 3-kinase C2 domain-containing subunit alpha [Eumeta japonica]|uniref:Phosphatidylinositol 4-phosphate 3-kinase C2 domain-containing subunit alpha n=1 Tax=Eumeta variegata TaxID=151549 RepID=A0A4C1WB08_EUMVA|nr:Phosphatidylinositol 4-phosphate 3-kinase C2 domain-containing subunit alpha [Eumeta japonica]